MDDQAAELLAQMLVMAEAELQERFRTTPQAKDGDRAKIRHETYLAVIQLWMKTQ